ncbi:MAG: molybdenum cofactor guanylyltransferase [Chloroflexi bacterium]|nr:molybdenum cofactor guanylyltransferase [Chloroflexota bacterium]
MEITGIVLAGGKGARLGHDKVLEILDGQSLLQKVVSRIKPLCVEIIVVTGERHISSLPDEPALKTVRDVLPGRGPLGGIYTGLKTATSRYNIVVACDMPFLNTELLGGMVKLAPGYDAVVPRVGELVEPLHAVYSRDCRTPIEAMMDASDLSIYHLLRRVKVRYVEGDDIDRYDPDHLSFFNINTGADLEKARELARHEVRR